MIRRLFIFYFLFCSAANHEEKELGSDLVPFLFSKMNSKFKIQNSKFKIQNSKFKIYQNYKKSSPSRFHRSVRMLEIFINTIAEVIRFFFFIKQK